MLNNKSGSNGKRNLVMLLKDQCWSVQRWEIHRFPQHQSVYFTYCTNITVVELLVLQTKSRIIRFLMLYLYCIIATATTTITSILLHHHLQYYYLILLLLYRLLLHYYQVLSTTLTTSTNITRTGHYLTTTNVLDISIYYSVLLLLTYSIE